MGPVDQHFDDLTEISGIAETTQQRLRDFCGVRTYADLAALSASEIEAGLRAANQKIINRVRIEAWIDEARILASKRNASSGSESVSPELAYANNPHHSSGEVPSRQDWKPIASFVVEFQEWLAPDETHKYHTTIHYIEEDRNEEWEGIERVQHCQWMLEQLGDRFPAPFEEVVQESLPSPLSVLNTAPPVQVNIIQLRIRPSGAEKADVADNIVQARQPLTITVSFELLGENAATLMKEQATCVVRLYVYNRSSGTSALIGEVSQHIASDKEIQTVVFSEVRLTPGTYRLFGTVSLIEANAIPALVQIPQVHVT